MLFNNTNSDRPWLDNQPFSPQSLAAKGSAQGPSAQQLPAPVMNSGASVAPAFVPEQAPPMLPMQGGMPQMTAGKGSGKGPMQMQQPMQAQAGPGNLNGADATMPQPMDLQALIQSLMASGLLGGL